MSNTWRNKLIQAVGMSLDYIDANNNCFSNPKDFFGSFTNSIYSGTINEGLKIYAYATKCTSLIVNHQ